MINKIIIDGQNVELTEESQVPFKYTFSQAKTHEVEIGLDTTDEIPAEAFKDCVRLTYISLPEEIHMIKRSAFKNCSRLPKMVLGSTIEYVGKEAFDGCDALVDLTIERQTPPDWYCTLPNHTNVYVPDGSKYKLVENFDTIDQTGNTEYYEKAVITNSKRKSTEYGAYKVIDDVTMMTAEGTYFYNNWAKIGDNNHIIEEKDRIPIEDIKILNNGVEDTVINIRKGDILRLSYVLLPEDNTNHHIYWLTSVDGEHVVNDDPTSDLIFEVEPDTGEAGTVDIKINKTGNFDLEGISETTGIRKQVSMHVTEN